MAQPIITPPTAPPRYRRGRLLGLYGTSVGRKWVMAVSGIAILSFVIAHLLGTLKIYLGAEETDAYGEALRDLGGDLVPRTHLLWIVRIGLILAFAIHLHAAFSLDHRNRQARGHTSKKDYIATNYASRTMLWSGIIVGLFILFHLADLSFGATGYDFTRGSVYDNQIQTFERPLVSGIYLVGVAALTLHLQHGLWSLFQTLGVSANAVPTPPGESPQRRWPSPSESHTPRCP